MKTSVQELERILRGGVFIRWPDAFVALCSFCEGHEISLRFGYRPGWVQKPDNPEPHLDKDSQGFTVEVGLTSFAGDDGGEALYHQATHAVYDGLRLLKMAIADEQRPNVNTRPAPPLVGFDA